MLSRADMRETAGFCSALLVAAYGVVRRPKSGVRRVSDAVRLWISGFGRDGKVEAGIAKRRLDCCKVCPLFFQNKTCGSPLHPTHPNLGCHCLMAKKVRYKDARCWLDLYARNTDNSPDANSWEYNGIP